MAEEIPATTAELRSLLAPLRRAVLRATPTDPRLTSLTEAQLELLRAIERLGPITTTRLASELSLARPTVSNTVKTLTDAGLIVRERSGSDLRAVLLSVPPPTQAMLEEASNSRMAALQDTVASLSEVERLTLRASLPVLKKILESLQGKADP